MDQLKYWINISLLGICFFCILGLGYAQNALHFSSQKEIITLRKADLTDRYTEGQMTTQVMIGGLLSDLHIGPCTDDLNLIQNNIRIGRMLYSPHDEDGSFRGNMEAIFEWSTSAITSDYGHIMVGPAILLRYNFVQPQWDFVPYVQVGAGIAYTDAYKDYSQRAIGQAFEFTPQAAVGTRILINENWSLDFEVMFHHISNAGMSSRNLGVNQLGGFMGFTYFWENEENSKKLLPKSEDSSKED